MVAADRDKLYEEIRGNLDRYIIKPQQEGGSKNFAGKDIPDVLDNFEIMNTSIIMGRIKPPENDTFVIREGKISQEKTNTEIGIFGIIISDDTTVHVNKNAGYLLRTKNADSMDGGVISGLSAIDTPYLVDSQS